MAEIKKTGLIRLDQYLAQMGKGSRSEVKKWIKKGQVSIDGQEERHPEHKVQIGKEKICLNGKEVPYVAYEYMMFHKPAGCVSATEDAKERTVLDYIDTNDCVRKKELFPVGRLDKDTEGLLLLTNDGELAHRLLSPGKHVKKKYLVHLREEVREEDAKRFEEGLDIGDEKKTMPAKLEYVCSDNKKQVYVWIEEGRFHQIKRMFEACGNEVLYLKRLQMGALKLDENLHPGQYRHLTEQELMDCQKGTSVLSD